MSEEKLTTKWYYVAVMSDPPGANWIHEDNLKIERQQTLAGTELKLLTCLSAMVWGKTRKIVRYPETWLDAFKLRWFPKWARDKWPPTIVKIRYDEIIPMLSTKENISSIVMIKSKESHDYILEDGEKP